MWYYVATKDVNELMIDVKELPKMTSEGGIYHMRQGPFQTINELIEKAKIHDKTCSVCKGLIGLRFYPDINKKLIEKQMCFSCELWDDRAKNIKERHMIVNHEFYSIADPNVRSPVGTKGFGGRKFTFIKNGITVESDNVWYGGEIPKLFWDKIPDNASLI